MYAFHRIVATLMLVCGIFPTQAASIWFADDRSVNQVDTDSNSITRSISLDKVHELAVDAADSSLWVATGQQLLKFDAAGNPLLQIGLHPLDLLQPRHLASDPYDSSLWMADQGKLAHLNNQGQLLGEWQTSGLIRAMSLSLDQSLWLLSNKYLMHYSVQGTLLASYDLQAVVQEEPKFIAVDSIGNRLWLAGEKQLLQFDTGNLNQPLSNITLSAVIADLTLDTNSGALWVVTQQSLLSYASTGSWINTVSLSALAIEMPQRLVYDATSPSLWLGHKTGFSRLTTSGALIVTLPNARTVQAIGVSPLMVTPTFSLIQPPQDALSNNPQPTITLGYGALCSGQPCGFNPAYFSSYSLSALLNNQPIGNLFVFDPLTGQTSYTPASVLPQGGNPFTAQATDHFGHVSNRIDSIFTIDTIPPVITLTTMPASLTNQPLQTLMGTLSEQAILLVNSQMVAVGAAPNFSFSHSVTLVEGINTLQLVAIDTAGNRAYQTLTITLDTVPPAAPDVSLIAAATPVDGQTTVTAMAGAVEAASTVRITNLTSNQTVTVSAAADGGFTATIAAFSGDELSILAIDQAGNQGSAANVTVPGSGGGGDIPPDPSTVAPAVDQTVASNLLTTTAFLYSGANAIQQGVTPGTIEAKRVAVLRGKAYTRDNQPLPGVRVTILNHPEFGYTVTRADGMFDIAVNGGGVLTINYEKSGFLPVQRQVNAPWQDFAWADEVVMIALDIQVTTINLASSTAIQVARGSTSTDSDGTRQATLLFTPGTTASMVLADGTTQALTTLNVRATEYTVGANGPQAMPGALPPTSGYTYAVELSADEAIAAGAKQINFSQPVPVYVENFLNFPVGGIVPAGYYDRNKGIWIPAPNGRVIKILAIANGLADLDTDGDGLADDAAKLALLNISDAERQQLATLYQAGVSLWRVPVSHFTPWDCNWPFGPPPGAAPPGGGPPGGGGGEDNPTGECGSIIECQNQTLGERIAVTGAPFTLNYRSSRVPGRMLNSIEIPLSGSSVPASLKRIELVISVAGQQLKRSFPASPNQTYRFTWDGKDGYNRAMRGSHLASIQIGYVYGLVYQEPAQFAQSFAMLSGIPISGLSRGSAEFILWRMSRSTLVISDARSMGWGGWTASIHHQYDPIGKILLMGDGTRRSGESISRAITTVAGNGSYGFSGDGGIATEASLSHPAGVSGDAQGNLYIANRSGHRVRKVSPNGVITTLAGVTFAGFIGDGGAATAAALYFPVGVNSDSNGNVFIADSYNHRIRKVSPDGIITTVAGSNSTLGFSGDGGMATAARLNSPLGVSSDTQGNLFIADAGNYRVRKVSPDGIITTVAGNGTAGFSGDGGAATAAKINLPSGVSSDTQGNLYIADTQNNRIRKVSPDGIITTVAGNGTIGFSGDGGQATLARLYSPVAINNDFQGNLFITDYGNNRIRKVSPDGIITTVAGNGTTGFSGDGGLATAARLSSPYSASSDTQGNVFIADTFNNRIRKFASPLPGFDGADLIFLSVDGSQLYHFDPSGRHLRTLNAKTNAVLYSFTYDSAGRLTQITDGDNNQTLIERDPAGNPTAIVSADNQRTTLALDGNGYLATLTNPVGEAYRMAYTTDGLLTKFTDPKGNASSMTYDTLGRLTRDQNAAGGFWALNRIDLTSDNYEASMASAENRTTTYRVENLSTGNKRRTNFYPDGTKNIDLIQTNGTTITTAADGTITTSTEGPDPRFGILAPITQSLTVKTPSGLTLSGSTTRTTALSNPANPLSLVSETTTVTVNGNSSKTIYDAALKQFTLTSPLNRSSVVKTDALGRVIQQQYATLQPVSYLYDTRGRLSNITQGTGTTARSATLAYNTQGQLQSATDPLGRTVNYQYDLANRLTQQTLPDGHVVSYSYDANGNLTGLTPPSRPKHAFAYTPVNLESQYTPPTIGLATSQTQYAYNLDKDLTTITRPDGQLINFAYDSGGRLSTLVSTPSPAGGGLGVGVNLAYTYAATTGNLQTITALGNAGLSYTYDGSLLLTETWSGAVVGNVARTYNTDFRPITYSVNGTALAFAYDKDGLITQAGSLTLTRNLVTGFVTATTLGQATTSQGFNTFGELSQLSASASGISLLNTDFTRDAVGRITAKTETIQGQTDSYSFGYDTAGRLTGVSKNGILIAQYTYDSNGNRSQVSFGATTITATYDDQDRLTNYGGISYTYSANGELQGKTLNGQTTSYGYDVLGNLKTVTLPDTTSIEYIVDGRNRRIGKKVNGILMQGLLYQDQLKPIAELDGANNVVSRFVYATKPNVPEYMVKGGISYRIITDHLGSPRLVINTIDGTVVQRMDYDEFGNVTLDSNPGFQPFGFAGGLYDQHTRLTRFGARDYDVQTGRWVAKDPIRFAGGDTNLYGYTFSDPVNFVDPLGLVGGSPLFDPKNDSINNRPGPTDQTGRTGRTGAIIERGPDRPRWNDKLSDRIFDKTIEKIIGIPAVASKSPVGMFIWGMTYSSETGGCNGGYCTDMMPPPPNVCPAP